MALKPRYKRRIFWSLLLVVAAMALAVIMVPPMVTLNNLKPKIEAVIEQQTGWRAKINGNINFSLLGGLKIAAHDLILPNGTIDNALFRVPARYMFDLESAPLTGQIYVYGASLDINQLTPPKFRNDVGFKNSTIRFKGKSYKLVDAMMSGGLLHGTVRTSQHKYEFDSDGNKFHILNKNNNLDISGNLYSDGSADGTLYIDTDDINGWFEFKEPKIRRRMKLSMDFYWNGNYGFKFSNISGDNINGEIELFDDGRRNITLRSDNTDLDLTFLLGQTGIFYDTSFNLDIRGNIRFSDKEFKHLKIEATGTKSDILIRNITTDNMVISGGIITARGAQDMPIRMTIDGQMAYCLFSGAPDAWKCAEFSYGGMTGSISADNEKFEIFIQSDEKMPESRDFAAKTAFLGERGKINFQFADIGGTITINKKHVEPSYTFAKNKNLEWLGTDMYFLPEFMRTATGDFSWNADGLSFAPHSNRWRMHTNKGFFVISGKNIKDWIPDIDLRSMNDLEYVVSGNYKNKSISNLKIKIAGMEFDGRVAGDSVTLATDLLNIDAFSNQNFVDDYDELQFLTGEPLMLPFAIGTKISLTANSIIYNGNTFGNFVYSLRDSVQNFSITDSQRGNLLASITKNQNKYNILLQLNRFVISDRLLSLDTAMNVSDTTITGQVSLSTYGQIAYDIWYNLSGHLDASFEGGIIYGLGVDEFYSKAANATRMNAEYMLSDALDGGVSQLKSLRIIGDYSGGNFATTRPFAVSMRHADAAGDLKIAGGKMSVQMNLIMRGTSPQPAPILIDILPNGQRNYSLSQIMTTFDPDFLRSFVTTHDKF